MKLNNIGHRTQRKKIGLYVKAMFLFGKNKPQYAYSYLIFLNLN